MQNVLKIIAKKLYFKESRNFIRENTETAVHGFLAFIERKIPVAEFYYNKVARLKGGLSARMT